MPLSNAVLRGRIVSLQLREGMIRKLSEQDLEDLLAYIIYLEKRSKDE